MVLRVTPRVWGTALSAETAMKYLVSQPAAGHTSWIWVERSVVPQARFFCQDEALITRKYATVFGRLYHAVGIFMPEKLA